MSMENVRKFLEMVKTDEKLARKVVELKDRIKADVKLGEEKEILAEKVVPLARDCNLEFTVDDFIAFANSEVKNLSKEDLLAISGGKISHIPALGLLFAAGLAFAPSAMGNIPDLPLIEHVAEAATTAEEVENELVEYIKEFLEIIDLSDPGDVDALNTFAEGNVSVWLKEKGIGFTRDAKNPKIFYCIKGGETFVINVDVLIHDLTATTAETAAKVGAEITTYVKEYLMAEEKKVKQGHYPQISVYEIRNEVKEKFGKIIKGTSMKTGSVKYELRRWKAEDHEKELAYLAKPREVNIEFRHVIFHCNEKGKAFDIDVDKLISQAIKDLFVLNAKSRAKGGLMSRDYLSESEVYNVFRQMAQAWLSYRNLVVSRSSQDIIHCYSSNGADLLFDVNLKDLFNEVCIEMGLKPLQDAQTKEDPYKPQDLFDEGCIELRLEPLQDAQTKEDPYIPLDRRNDSWQKIVETLLGALNSADFDLNKYSQTSQEALKADLKWFANYIKGPLGECYAKGWLIFDTYGSGEPTDKITAQLSVLKAFVEEGFTKGERTQEAVSVLAKFPG